MNYSKIRLFRWVISCIFLMMLFACQKKVEAPILHDAQGHAVDTATWQKQWMIVHYWATWCDNCVHELKELNQFYLDNQHQPNKVKFYGVNYDYFAPQELLLAVQRMKIAFPVLQEDPVTLLHLPPVPDALPVTFIVNPAGKVVKQILGPVTARSLSADLALLQHAALA